MSLGPIGTKTPPFQPDVVDGQQILLSINNIVNAYTPVKGVLLMIDSETVGGRIRDVRQERDMTLSAFAEALGISHSYLSQLENDKAQPTRKLLLSIERAFNVRAAWLETGEEPRQADVRKLIKDLLASYPKDVQIMALLEFAKAEQHDVLLDALMSTPVIQVADPRLKLILDFIKERWEHSDDRQRLLVEIRLARVFPEFEEFMTRPADSSSSGAAGDQQ
jgi:transcriptional regulator with XRE-family HTH domain